MSKSQLKRGGPKQQSRDAEDSTRHASKKRKLAGELKESDIRGSEASTDATSSKANGNTDIQSTNHSKSSESAGIENSPKKNAEKEKKSKSKHKSKHENRKRWEVSTSNCGRFLALDTIFVGDQKHVIVATKAAVQIYSTSTSLLIRSLIPDTESPITTYALSPVDPEVLFVGTYSGYIAKWNWATGQLLSSFAGPSDLLCLVAVPAEAPEDYQDLLYSLHRSGDKQRSLSFLRVGKDSTTQIQLLLDRRFISQNMYLTKDGKILVLCGGQKLIFGAVHLLAKPRGESRNVTFREVTLSEEVSSIDVRERVKSTSSKPQDPALDIAIGTRRGPILVYDDAYGNLLARERQKEGNVPGELIPRRLHWHREVVNSVKWSRDGNYVISGGRETVLVIWQLDTSQKQFLPHLTAEITNITVSPAGTSYAVQLSNNTNIILATSELKPTATMSGLDLSIPSNFKDKKSQRKPLRSIATANSNRSDEILLSTYSMLQAFNTRTSQTVSRQALTRNNVTNVNVNPAGAKIKDPAVTQISISHDGLWLATVDEWSPPLEDLDALHPQGSIDQAGKEVYLKFWSYDPVDKMWQLSSRIDGPHSESSGGLGRIFELQTNPSHLEFASIGDDGNVKVWSPRRRTRNGQIVKDKNGRPLLDWSCRYEAWAECSDLSSLIGASLAWSEDGSVLAAHLQIDSSGANSSVKLVNNITGTLQHGFGLAAFPIQHSRLAILGRHLIIASHCLFVFDLVNGDLDFSIPILSTKRNPNPITEGFMTVNLGSQTFAIALPQDPKHGHIPQTSLSIFHPDRPQPLYITVMSANITALLSDHSTGGFVTIDDEGVIRKFRPASAVGTTADSLGLPEPEMKLGLADMFDPSRTLVSTSTAITSTSLGEQLATEDSASKLGPNGSISSIFGNLGPDHQAGTMPMLELFERFAQNLVRRKDADVHMEE